MEKWILVALAVIILPITLACVPTAATPAATPAVTPIAEIQNWKTNMDTWKTTVADPAIAKINAQGASNTSQLQTELASAKATLTEQSSQITALTTRITNLENWQTTVGTTSTTGSTGIATGGTSGQIAQFTPGTPPVGSIVTSASGGVVSQVNWVQGTTQMFSSPNGSSNNIWYVQRLINQSTAIQYVRPMITMGVSSQYGYLSQAYFAGMDVQISSAQGSIQGYYVPQGGWTSNTTAWPQASPGVNTVYANIGSGQASSSPYAPNTPYKFSLAPGLGQLTNSMLIMPTGGLSNNLGEFYISPGGYIDVTVMLQGVYTSTATMWNISASYSSHT